MSIDEASLRNVVSLMLSNHRLSIRQGCELAESLCTQEDTFRFLLEHLGSLDTSSYLHVWSLSVLGRWDQSIIENTTELYFNDPLFLELPSCIRVFKNLKEFSIGMNCQIHSIPSWIGDLTSLEILHIDLSNSPCSTLPDTIGQLVNLQEFTLSSEKVAFLPDTMGNLSKLHTLKLDCNHCSPQLLQLPDSFARLSNLRIFEWVCAEYAILGDWIGGLTNLSELSLQNNGITRLPDTFGNLTNLRCLNLVDNNLSELPESFCNLKNLSNLDLFNSNALVIPSSIGALESLTHLNIEHTYQSELPESFYNLKNLEVLYASKDDLSDETRNLIEERLPACVISIYWSGF